MLDVGMGKLHKKGIIFAVSKSVRITAPPNIYRVPIQTFRFLRTASRLAVWEKQSWLGNVKAIPYL